MRLGARSMFKGFFVIISRSPRRQQKKENPDIPRVGIFYLLKPSIILIFVCVFFFTAAKIDNIFQTNKFLERKKRKK